MDTSGTIQAMDTEPPETPKIPDPDQLKRDPQALHDAHGTYGSYLQQAGLPFEPEEMEEEEDEGESTAEDA